MREQLNAVFRDNKCIFNVAGMAAGAVERRLKAHNHAGLKHTRLFRGNKGGILAEDAAADGMPEMPAHIVPHSNGLFHATENVAHPDAGPDMPDTPFIASPQRGVKLLALWQRIVAHGTGPSQIRLIPVGIGPAVQPDNMPTHQRRFPGHPRRSDPGAKGVRLAVRRQIRSQLKAGPVEIRMQAGVSHAGNCGLHGLVHRQLCELCVVTQNINFPGRLNQSGLRQQPGAVRELLRPEQLPQEAAGVIGNPSALNSHTNRPFAGSELCRHTKCPVQVRLYLPGHPLEGVILNVNPDRIRLDVDRRVADFLRGHFLKFAAHQCYPAVRRHHADGVSCLPGAAKASGCEARAVKTPSAAASSLES
jgi:hypothetical protein